VLGRLSMMMTIINNDDNGDYDNDDNENVDSEWW
jgi:hypothetical protein